MKKVGNLRGFTIVELLIVIVIIGILATLVIVAYNGIQTRAKNNSRYTEAAAWAKIISAYRVQYGVWPISSGSSCLGDGYADENADGSGDCYDSNTSNRISVNSAVNTELLKATTSLPKSIREPITGPGDGTKRLGFYVTFNGTNAALPLYYFVEGITSPCTVGDVQWTGNATHNARLCIVNIQPQ